MYVHWIHLARDRAQWRVHVNTGLEPSDCVKDEKSLGRLRDPATPSVRCSPDPSGSHGVGRIRSVAQALSLLARGVLPSVQTKLLTATALIL
jgi:hypothetical protein